MINVKLLAILAIIGVVFLFGGSIYQNFDIWLKTQLNGPEYCFRDIDKATISAAAQGVEVTYTKEQGNELCFRTKDSSIVERLNKQIQDRKLQAQLAEIEAKRQFWNDTFPRLFIFGLVALIVIIIIFYLANRNDRGGYY